MVIQWIMDVCHGLVGLVSNYYWSWSDLKKKKIKTGNSGTSFSREEVMWEVPPYAVNVLLYWLTQKLLWPIEGQNTARQEIQEERQGERRYSWGDTSSSQRTKTPEHYW